MIQLKKSARKLSLRKRFLALSSNEAVHLRFYEKQLLKLMLRLRNHRLSKDTKAKGIAIASLLLNEMINIATEPAVTLEPLIDYRRTIDSFTASECWNFFETRKEDLPRLRRAFTVVFSFPIKPSCVAKRSLTNFSHLSFVLP